ncbi:MAG: hypothetical protein JSU81_05615, partial [Candidatus Coatesbacteria bacterium]
MERPPFSRLAPASRLGILVGTLVLFTTFNHPAYVAPLLFVVAAAATAACGAGKALRRAAPLALAFLFFSVLLWPPFIGEGEPVARLGVYRATATGVWYGLAVGLRIVGMLFAGLAFLAATTPEEFGAALRTFR